MLVAEPYLQAIALTENWLHIDDLMPARAMKAYLIIMAPLRRYYST